MTKQIILLSLFCGICLIPSKYGNAQTPHAIRRVTITATNPLTYGPPNRSTIPGLVPGWWCFRTPSGYSHCERDVTFCRHIGIGLGVPGFDYNSCRYRYNAFCITYRRSDDQNAHLCSESMSSCIENREGVINSGLSTEISYCGRFR